MGDQGQGTGDGVLLWIEQATMLSNFRPPEIVIHSDDESSRHKVEAATGKIKRIERARYQVERV